MSYEKITFVDRIAEYPTRRKLTTIDTQQTFGTYDVSRDEGTVSQEGTALNAATFNALQANVESAFVEVDDNIASAYDSTSTYSEGDFCIYEGVLYQANQDIETAEAWDSTHWDSVKLTDIMGTGSASIDDTVVTPDKTWSSSHIVSLLPTDTATGSIASFPDGANGIPLQSLILNVKPYQAGTGDPSPSNVRPISGHTQAVITRTGKNIFDISTLNQGTITVTDGVATGTSSQFNSSFGNSNPIYNQNEDYKISFSFEAKTDGNQGTSGSGLTIGFVYTDGTITAVVSVPNNTSSYTRFSATSQSNKVLKAITISYSSLGSNNWYVKNVQIEINATTATAYEPYIAATRTASFGQTIYGATIDPLTGDGTITHGFYTFDGTETAIEYGSGYRYVVLTGKEAKTYGAVETPSLLSNKFVAINRNQVSSGTTGASITGDTVLLSTDSPAGVQICYELATPEPITITPIENITTLYGANNIFQDAGDTTVTYKADIGLYIEKKTS